MAIVVYPCICASFRAFDIEGSNQIGLAVGKSVDLCKGKKETSRLPHLLVGGSQWL
jgi:hypothetical protein